MRVTSQVGNVEQRKLGKTGLGVSAIGSGCRYRRWEQQMLLTPQELEVGIMACGPMAHGPLAGTMPREKALTMSSGLGSHAD
jgi:aryl-alcohol dehydrogenase-like predicted oxidoreductase